MEDDELEHHRPDSGHFPVEGMESVLATVSGYHGSERFNLIKLIYHAGGSYVGNMNQCVTHLVCWEFEGRKYEFANKLNKLKKNKIAIVNHCWVEECVKEGRRVSEEPYTFQSGKEMGPLRLDVSLWINQAKAQSKALKKAKGLVIDVEPEAMENAAWTDSILFDEQQKNLSSDRPIRKAAKRNLRNATPSRSKHCLENPPGSSTKKLKEASNSSNFCRLKKRNSTSLEPQRRGRRLVKKQTIMDDWLLNSIVEEDCEEIKVLPPQRRGRRLVKKQTIMDDWLLNSIVEEDCEEIKVLPESNSSKIPFDRSDAQRHQSTSNRNASDVRREQDNNVACDEVEEIKQMNEGNENRNLATSKELCQAANVDIDHGKRLPASPELSCVICWTDFSSTRGVLPCGHRFCFSCIQNWADHMASTRKPSTCPLCKSSFVCITKVDDAVPSDQKIYSQSIPHDSSNMNIYFLPDENHCPPIHASPAVCHLCSSIEPEDLLVPCNSCENRRVHIFCLDPPSLPWTCAHCRDLRGLYRHTRQFT